MFSFTSDYLNNYIAFKLGLDRAKFTNEELALVEELDLDPAADKEYFEIKEDFLSFFPGLKHLGLKNMYIDKSFINKLKTIKNLESLSLINSNIEDVTSLSILNLKSLSLNNTYISNYEGLSSLKSLYILSLINMGDVDLINLRGLVNLISLSFNKTNILKAELFRNYPFLESLDIDNTNINNLIVIEDLKRLKKLNISYAAYLKNRMFIKRLLNNHTVITVDGINDLSKGGKLG